MRTFSIVIPALDEEEGLPDVLRRAHSIEEPLRLQGFDRFELIVVDDGSSDGTAEIARQGGARVLRHRRTLGYGAALKTGFAAASGDWIGFLDADGTYPPERFPDLIAAATRTGADLVVGSRLAGLASGMPRLRRFGNRLFARLVSLASGRRVTDSASGMRVFRRAILARLYPLPSGLDLTPVMTTRALHERLAIVEVPIPYDRRAGRSKLKLVRDGAAFAQSIVWTALNYDPGRLLGMVAGAAGAAAVVVAAVLVALRLRGVTTLGPVGVWATYAAVVLAVAAVSLAGLGASFGYFVALFQTTRHDDDRGHQAAAHPPALLRAPWARAQGWLGLGALGAGVAVGAVTLRMGLSGWEISRTWIYYLFSACLCLVGVQMMIAWVQMQVLEALRERDARVSLDLSGDETCDPSAAAAGTYGTERSLAP